MTQQIEQMVQQLESADRVEVSRQTGLSQSDIAAVQNTPLWRLRQQLVGEQDNVSD